MRATLHSLPATWAYLDLILVAVLTVGAHTLLAMTGKIQGWAAGPWLSASAFSVCVTLSGLVFGLYEQRTLMARSRILVRSCMTIGLGVLLGYATVMLFFYAESTRWLGLIVGATYLLTAVPIRLHAHETISSYRSRVLCIGTGDSIRKLVSLLGGTLRRRFDIVGHLAAPSELEPAGAEIATGERDHAQSGSDGLDDYCRRCPRLGTVQQISGVLDACQVDEVIVGSELANDDDVGAAIMECLERHFRITDQPTFVEKLLAEVPAEDITAHWFLLADVQTKAAFERVKRLIDIGAALIGLLVTGPIWPLIAVAIRLDSPGPAIYRQQRVGLHGKTFTIFKFRTMRPDAEANGVRWAAANDPRITRVGKLLRKTRLDELPQLLNVLRGQMSLVGPRPERPEFVAQLAEAIPHYNHRHMIQPGLTGWAQIHYRYGASIEDARRKLCYDLYYLKHRSIDLDIAILIRTIGTVMIGAR
jgi:exopolysaccharide biosynthesis polyprenyl glycosylphosphotransferase